MLTAGRRRGADGGGGGRQKKKRKSTATTITTTTTTTTTSKSTNTSMNTINLATGNDNCTKLKTSKECAKKWSDLLVFADGRRKKYGYLTREQQQQNIHANIDSSSRFDCSDLIVPPAYELINLEVAQGVKRWEDLASRVIVDEDDGKDYYDGEVDDDDDDDSGGGRFINKDHGNLEEREVDKIMEEGGRGVPRVRNRELLLDAATRGDKRKQRLLPFNFDYACKTTGPSMGDVSEEIDGQKKQERMQRHYRPRVISLLDPTQTCDYEEELWKVFRSVKTLDELEWRHALGERRDIVASSYNFNNNEEDDSSPNIPSHGCRHTLAVKSNMKEWLAKYSRMDAHSLGRLRVRDRHSNPLHSPITDSTTNAVTTATKSNSSSEKRTTSTTLRFEIHRHSQPPKRGSGPDANRLEVELHGQHHTLLDLHRLLVEFALNASSNDENNDTASAVGGVFFIENVFYTCGADGKRVQEAIRIWLDSKAKGEGDTASVNAAEAEALSLLRREYLGLSSSSTNNAAIPMVEMMLEDLPVRLGVRYFHMFIPPPIPLFQNVSSSSSSALSAWCLSNESAVYVIGIHTHIIGSDSNATTEKGGEEEKEKEVRHVPPIIIHDAWSPPLRHVCHACQHSYASIVTVDDELTDAPPPGLDGTTGRVHVWGVPMCSYCFRALHYRPASREECGNEDICGEAKATTNFLELRSRHGPSLVFLIEDYQRMVTASEYRMNGL